MSKSKDKPKKQAQPAAPMPPQIHKPAAESADDIRIRGTRAPTAHNYPGKPFA